MNKDMQQLLRRARKSGCAVIRTGRHVRVVVPSGAAITVSSSPSDYRAVLNTRSQLRRAGVRL